MVLPCGLEGIACINTTHNTKNQTNHDQDLDYLKHSWMKEGVVRLKNAVEKAAEKSKSCKLERRETDRIQNCGAGIETDAGWVADSCELHARANDTSQTEKDQVEPA